MSFACALYFGVPDSVAGTPRFRARRAARLPLAAREWDSTWFSVCLLVEPIELRDLRDPGQDLDLPFGAASRRLPA